MSESDRFDLEQLSDQELENLHAHLQKELEVREENKIKQVENEYRRLAASIGMEPEEVVMQMQRKGAKRTSAQGVRKEVRYQNPDNPLQTWAGRGKRPKWLTEKLENGASLEDYKVL